MGAAASAHAATTTSSHRRKKTEAREREREKERERRRERDKAEQKSSRQLPQRDLAKSAGKDYKPLHQREPLGTPSPLASSPGRAQHRAATPPTTSSILRPQPYPARVLYIHIHTMYVYMCLLPPVISCPCTSLPLAAQAVITLLFMHTPCASHTNHLVRKTNQQAGIRPCTPTFVFVTPTIQLLLYCKPGLRQPSKAWRQGRKLLDTPLSLQTFAWLPMGPTALVPVLAVHGRAVEAFKVWYLG